jgi:predicted Zn-dependent protease
MNWILDEARKHAYGMYRAEQWAEMETLIKGVLAANPRDAWALSLYASMLRKQHKFREALVLLETAHALDPRSAHIAAMREELRMFVNQIGGAAPSLH